MSWASDKARELTDEFFSPKSLLTVEEAVERAIRETLEAAAEAAERESERHEDNGQPGLIVAAIRRLGEP